MVKNLAIIGAGPGGLFAAKEATLRGLSVTVFNKGRVGEGFSCAEGFFDVLKLLDPPVAGVCFKVQEAYLTVIDTFAVDCSKLNMWMIDRAVWQKHLANEVAQLGCEIIENRPLKPEEFSRLERNYDWVIDASGFSPLSQKVFNLEAVRFGITAQNTLEGDFTEFVGKVKIAADRRFCGYSWIFPKGSSTANVGVGWFGNRQRGLRIGEVLQEVLQNEGLETYKVLKSVGGPIPVVRRKKLIFGKTLLVGDAAGFASPLHGGGIDTACISGKLAAKAIAANDPQLYEKNIETVIGMRLNLEHKIKAVWEQMDLKAQNQFLAFNLGKEEEGLSLRSFKRTVTQEAAIFQYIAGGQLRANWNQGLILDDLPFLAKVLIRKIMAGDGLS
jgi:digeranylgeranylglycerophospholipid reductase